MNRDDPAAVDSKFLLALAAGQYDAVDQILADDFVLVDLSGAVVPKTDFLAGLRAGVLRIEAIEPSDVAVRLYPGAALVTGRTAMRGTFQGAPFAFQSRYTHAYIEQGGRWRMVGAQGTPIVEPAVAAASGPA